MLDQHSVNAYIGAKLSQILICPVFPDSHSPSPIALAQGSVSHIYSSQSLLNNKIQCIFAIQNSLYTLYKDYEEADHQTVKNVYAVKHVCDLPLSQKQNSLKIINAYADDVNFYVVTNAGELLFRKISDNQQELVKVYDNKTMFGNTSPNPKKQYKKSIMSKDKQYFAIVGKDLLPFLYDKDQSVISWKGKNVPNDYLDLQVPINDVDAVFFQGNNCLLTANADRNIRIYDVRSRNRKPTGNYPLKLMNEKCSLTKLGVSADQKDFYVGNMEGGIYELDLRKNCSIVGKFKGINSTVSGIEVTNNFLISSSLDGYLRCYDKSDKKLVHKKYLGVTPTALCLTPTFQEQYQQYVQKQQAKQQQQKKRKQEQNSEQRHKRQRKRDKESEAEQKQETSNPQKKIKQLRVRNKIGLWYLKPENIGQFPDMDSDEIKLQAKKQEQIEQQESSSLL